MASTRDGVRPDPQRAELEFFLCVSTSVLSYRESIPTHRRLYSISLTPWPREVEDDILAMERVTHKGRSLSLIHSFHYSIVSAGPSCARQRTYVCYSASPTSCHEDDTRALCVFALELIYSSLRFSYLASLSLSINADEIIQKILTCCFTPRSSGFLMSATMDPRRLSWCVGHAEVLPTP